MYRRVLLAILIALVVGCASDYEKLKTLSKAKTESGNLSEALKMYQDYIAKHDNGTQKINPQVYLETALLASKLEKYKLGAQYFDKLRFDTIGGADRYYYASKCYQTIDNLSKEIEALEVFNKEFSTDGRISGINNRLFFTYVESENWDKAKNLWTILPNSDSNLNLLTQYYIVCKKLNLTDKEKIANSILKLDDNNFEANLYFANKHYNLAETLYKKEMDAYNKKRSRKQYKRLLKALDQTGKDYRKARDLFEKIFKIKKDKKVAKFLMNIYARLNNKKKVNYYKKYI
jgi:tetratricopeptide (TPR) repeat protein